MIKAMCSPRKYIQGPKLLGEIDRHIKGLGNRLMLLLSEGGLRRLHPTLDACFEKKHWKLDYQIFSGECTHKKIERYADYCKKSGITAVVGIGGGKIIDTAKGVAYYAGLPVVIIPTVCSTDAPCSSISVLYNDDGIFEAYLPLGTNPDIVMVDTEIIAKAPVEYLVAGMGDAMSTYFEARACQAAGCCNPLGMAPTSTSIEIAALCWKYLRSDGLQAKQAVEQGRCTNELENIVEVNSYQSCIGFESGGLAAAHGIQKGFTVLPVLHSVHHGFKVAFCTVAQLMLERALEEEVTQVLAFCREVGLPICFADLGCPEITEEQIMQIAEKACEQGSTVFHVPVEVNIQTVTDALIKADEIGQKYHTACNKQQKRD